MITIGMDKELRKNSAYMIMFNLAMADIGISTFVHTFTSVGNKNITNNTTICLNALTLKKIIYVIFLFTHLRTSVM